MPENSLVFEDRDAGAALSFNRRPSGATATASASSDMGGGVAGFARGNFHAGPAPQVQMSRCGRRRHVAKVACERNGWRTWL